MRPAPARAAFILAAGLAAMATLGFTMTRGPSPAPAGCPPTVLLLYTGEQRGHLEPCGCTQPQIGGLPRRATFLASLPHGPAPVVVDDGDMVDDPGRQSQLKAEALAAFYRLNGYAAVNLGEQDFHLGFGYLRALQAEAKVPFLSANVRLGNHPAISETARPQG